MTTFTLTLIRTTVGVQAELYAPDEELPIAQSFAATADLAVADLIGKVTFD